MAMMRVRTSQVSYKSLAVVLGGHGDNVGQADATRLHFAHVPT